MPLKPEAGKTYRTRNGRVIPDLRRTRSPDYPFSGMIGDTVIVFTDEGRFALPQHGGGSDHPLDLVSVVDPPDLRLKG